MRIFLIFAIVVSMVASLTSQTTKDKDAAKAQPEVKTEAKPPAEAKAEAKSQAKPPVQAEAITGPLAVASRAKPGVQKFALDKLFMSSFVAGTAWSPDGRSIAFVTNLSGRRNLWLAPATG